MSLTMEMYMTHEISGNVMCPCLVNVLSDAAGYVYRKFTVNVIRNYVLDLGNVQDT